MVKGVDLFARHFAPYKDQYIIIGAVACSAAFSELEQDFRMTHDIDMVLIVEALSPEFVRAFWSFIRAGGYDHQSKSRGKPQYYRFDKPSHPEYPETIELFSRKPDILGEDYNGTLVPIPVDDELSSLSAIMLDDGYYSLLRQGRYDAGNLSCLKTEYLIIFKAKAWLDLRQRKLQGEQIDSRKINKHKNDILRLSQILDPQSEISLGKEIKDDLRLFLSLLEAEQMPLKEMGILNQKPADIINILRGIFSIY